MRGQLCAGWQTSVRSHCQAVAVQLKPRRRANPGFPGLCGNSAQTGKLRKVHRENHRSSGLPGEAAEPLEPPAAPKRCPAQASRHPTVREAAADTVSLQIAGTPAHVKRRGYCVALAEVGPIAAHVQAQPTALVVSIAAELRSAEQRFVLRSSRFPASQLEEAPSSSKARNR